MNMFEISKTYLLASNGHVLGLNYAICYLSIALNNSAAKLGIKMTKKAFSKGLLFPKNSHFGTKLGTLISEDPFKKVF